MTRKRKTDQPLTQEPDSSCIVPRLKRVNFAGALAGLHVPADQQPVSDPFVGDLVIAYVFDLPGAFQMVSTEDLVRLDLHREVLLPLAMQNLQPQMMSIDFDGSPPVLSLRVGSGLEACAMLLDDIWPQVAAKVPGELVCSVPARDKLFVTSSISEAGLSQVRAMSEEARMQADRHALSECLYVWRDGQWEVFAEPGAAADGGGR